MNIDIPIPLVIAENVNYHKQYSEEEKTMKNWFKKRYPGQAWEVLPISELVVAPSKPCFPMVGRVYLAQKMDQSTITKSLV